MSGLQQIYKIPGMGERDTLCGVVKSVIACTKSPAHFKKLVKYNCGDLDCPSCYLDLVKHDAQDATQALQDARVELRKAGLDPGHPFHVWYSPPPALRHLPLDKLRRQAIDYALQHGIIGGYIVDHAYRGSPAVLAAFREGKRDLAYSPHFHVVGFIPNGKPLEKSNDFHKRTGWTYGNKGNTNRKGKPRNIYETIKYELGHAARETWHRHRLLKRFGIMHSSKLKSVKDKCREEVRCPRCGAEVARYDPDTMEYLGPAHARPRAHIEIRPGALTWLVDRWRLEIRPMYLDLARLCQLEG